MHASLQVGPQVGVSVRSCAQKLEGLRGHA